MKGPPFAFPSPALSTRVRYTCIGPHFICKSKFISVHILKFWPSFALGGAHTYRRKHKFWKERREKNNNNNKFLQVFEARYAAVQQP